MQHGRNNSGARQKSFGSAPFVGAGSTTMMEGADHDSQRGNAAQRGHIPTRTILITNFHRRPPRMRRGAPIQTTPFVLRLVSTAASVRFSAVRYNSACSGGNSIIGPGRQRRWHPRAAACVSSSTNCRPSDRTRSRNERSLDACHLALRMAIRRDTPAICLPSELRCDGRVENRRVIE